LPSRTPGRGLSRPGAPRPPQTVGQHLPKRLRRRLLAELEDDLRDFRARLVEANRAPERRYAEDLPDDVICDDTLSGEMLQRRYLAVPLPRERAERAETLDPASLDGRSRITNLWLGQ
jgi:hypothetical protein